MNKIPYREKLRPGIRFAFTAIIIAALILVILFSTFLVFGLDQLFNITLTAPSFVWLLGFSVIIGMVVTRFLIRVFIEPITKLGKAMQRVTEGDFCIQLENKNKIKLFKNLYDNFNLMVKELNSTETLQTDFISNVSHEFKTPLNAIEGYASLLQDHQLSEEEQDKYIGKIIYNTTRLSSLVGNILLLSKISNQSIQSEKHVYRLDEQIRQSVVALESKWEAKNIEFDVELESIDYYGYENLLSHVWVNLIDNAIKFDPEGGMICMRLVREEHNALFYIEDNGSGIDGEDLKRIFNKFYQSDNSRGMEGNGLGLALVKRIVMLSDGTIGVKNLLECGCRFTVRLPISD